jgi:type II secretory pathway component PulJ
MTFTYPPSSSRLTPTGFTLVELLIASSIALTVMGALATLFSTFGRTASTSQAIVEMTNRMRSVGHRLRQDLEGVTVELTPWADPTSDSGYFELIEGPRSDTTDVDRKLLPAASMGGDPDDVLLFTTRSLAAPFTGKYDDATIQSPCAEVGWFCKLAPVQSITGVTVFNLYRKQFLVAAYVGMAPFLAGSNTLPGLVSDANLRYDISLRREGGLLRPNTLGHLTRRENRFRHQALFPHEFLSADKSDVTTLLHAATFDFDATGMKSPERDGEDVVLQNVLSFDVRVFDPDATVRAGASGPVFPGEPGYNAAIATATDPRGAYVDLGWSGNAAAAVNAAFPPANLTAFQSGGIATLNRIGSPVLAPPTYDTWSAHYEANGIDENGNGVIDEAANGEDDNNDGIPDDRLERETSPPYPVPLTGVEVRIRCIEPTTKEIRQVTIRHAFPRN